MFFSHSASEKLGIKYQSRILLFRHADHRANYKSIFSAGLPIFELNTDLPSLEQLNFEYRESIKLDSIFFPTKQNLNTVFGKMLPPPKKSFNLHYYISLGELDFSSFSLPSDFPHPHNHFLPKYHVSSHREKKSKDLKKIFSRYIQDFIAIFGVHSAR